MQWARRGGYVRPDSQATAKCPWGTGKFGRKVWEEQMNKITGALSVLSVAAVLFVAPGKPASADVIINNVLSPFTSITVVPGHRVHRPHTVWVHNPRHHQRCYRRWDPYFGEWNMHCVRMRYWGNEPYWN
jgi:hypothetical protein